MPPNSARSSNSVTAAAHPSGDTRFKLLEVAMRRHQFRQDALIEILHTAQNLFGFLSLDLLYFVAHHLKLPPSRVFGVATFYKYFTLAPKGRHTCIICTGTACYVRGSDQLLGAVRDLTNVQPGETSHDGEVSLVTARCLGACGAAPVVVLDGEIVGNQTPAALIRHVEGWLARGSVATA